jgi:hypothetical protein
VGVVLGSGDGVWLGVVVGVIVGVGLGVCVGVCVAVGEAVSVGVRLGVIVGVAVIVGVCVAVSVVTVLGSEVANGAVAVVMLASDASSGRRTRNQTPVNIPATTMARRTNPQTVGA